MAMYVYLDSINTGAHAAHAGALECESMLL